MDITNQFNIFSYLPKTIQYIFVNTFINKKGNNFDYLN